MSLHNAKIEYCIHLSDQVHFPSGSKYVAVKKENIHPKFDGLVRKSPFPTDSQNQRFFRTQEVCRLKISSHRPCLAS